MKGKMFLCAAVLGTVMMFCGTAFAEEQMGQEAPQSVLYQTEDGVLSIEAPDDGWNVVSDPNSWFVLSDGGSTITIDHFANGEALPACAVAGGETAAVYQAFVSTKNEVFAIKGTAAEQADLEDIIKIVGTIKVLKYDTKTAVSQEASKESGTGITPVNATYYCVSDYLNVRSGSSTNDDVIGYLGYGDAVTVLGSVTENGEDTGWYQVDYKGTTAYASAKFLTKTKPESSSDEGTDTSGSDEYFLVYGADGISVAIHPVGGAMYEDMEGRTYSKQDSGVYYCIETDETFTIDPPPADDTVNVEGDPYGDLDPENADTPASDEYFLVYGEDGISVAIHCVGGPMYEDLEGRQYAKQSSGAYKCIETGEYFTIEQPPMDDTVNVEA